jgi:hypothetical protein
VEQAPFWTVVPTWVEGFKAYNVSIVSKAEATAVQAFNTDGIEPMYRCHLASPWFARDHSVLTCV